MIEKVTVTKKDALKVIEILPDGKCAVFGKVYSGFNSAKTAVWYSRNREYISRYNAAYKKSNPEKIRQLRLSPDQIQKSRSRSRKRHYLFPEKFKEYRRNNPEKVKKWRLEYREKNRVKIANKQRLYRKLNKPIVNSYNKARGAKLKSPISQRKQIEAIYRQAESGNLKVCKWCGDSFLTLAHVDHIIPISKGGLHEISNLCISCPPCNLKKAAALPDVFKRK